MAKRASKTRKKSSCRVPKTGRAARQALARMDALHKSADALHEESEAVHKAAHAAHQKIRSVRKAGRLRTGGAPVKDLPPPGPPAERVEPAKTVGAPSPDDLQIVGLRPSALPFSVVGIGS